MPEEIQNRVKVISKEKYKGYCKGYMGTIENLTFLIQNGLVFELLIVIAFLVLFFAIKSQIHIVVILCFVVLLLVNTVTIYLQLKELLSLKKNRLYGYIYRVVVLPSSSVDEVKEFDKPYCFVQAFDNGLNLAEIIVAESVGYDKDKEIQYIGDM